MTSTSSLTFGGDMGRLQRALSQCQDMVMRRGTVLQALGPRTGEWVLDIGCGGGFYAYEAAQCVGPGGRVYAIDISADQVAAARARCAEVPWVECRVADATDLPYGDAEFDAVYCVQVIEYVPDLDRALEEIRRVLRPGGRLVNVATNWSSLVWRSDHPERMGRMLAAWAVHAPYPDLPTILAERLRRAGMQPLHQTPVPVLNTSYHANCCSYWTAKLIAAYAVGRKAVDEDEATVWMQEFEVLDQRGAYFFCSAPILTEAVRAA
jgi:arsenite methyltransferase